MGTRPGLGMFAGPLAWCIWLPACVGPMLGACSGPAVVPEPQATTADALDPGQPTRTPGELLEEAQGYYDQGQLERAAQAFQVVAWFAERERDDRVAVEALSMVSRCHGLLGDLQGMRQWLLRADEHARVSEPRGWSAFLLASGIARRTVGDLDQAYETFSELWTHSQAHGYGRHSLEAARLASEVAPEGDRVKWAERGLELTDAAARRGPGFGAHEQLVSRWVLGRAQRRDGELGDAYETLESMLLDARLAREIDGGARDTEWVGHALRELGEVAAASGDNARAVSYLNQALLALEEADLERNWSRGMAALRRRIRELEQAQ